MNIIEAETTFGRVIKMLFLCALGFVFAPLLLLLGYRRLRQIPEDDPNHRFLKIVLMLGTVFTVVMFGYLIWRFLPQEDENVPSVSWLPTVASNISYYRRPFECEYYEFTVTEDDFRKMYSREELLEIDPVNPVSIDRFAKFQEGRPEKDHTAVITHGLYRDKEIETVSGKYNTKIVFDRKTCRAYVSSRPQQ